MTNDQKIIKNKLGLLKLGETLGNVSQACIIRLARDLVLFDPHRSLPSQLG